MENPVLSLIHQHASCRHYKPDPIPAAIIETIVAAGQRASTSSNLQTYSIVAVTQPEKRQRLAELCGNQQHVAEAPVFLAWCADLRRLDRACELRGYIQESGYVESTLIAFTDVVIAAQNCALAAESLGLGICYIGSIRNNPEEVIELLGLPYHVFPVTGLTVGWPAKAPKIKPRLPLKAILHWERYDESAVDEALLEYDRTMIASGIYEGRQIPLPGKPEQMEPYGWIEHSARRVSQISRPGLRSILEKQGFGLK